MSARRVGGTQGAGTERKGAAPRRTSGSVVSGAAASAAESSAAESNSAESNSAAASGGAGGGSANGGAGSPRHRLDEVIHSPIRLCVVSALSGVDRAEFRAVRDAVDVSDSVLSKAVARLEEAGYVAVAKDRRGRRPTTYLSLTTAGETALEAHIAALAAITGRAAGLLGRGS
jgi:DNA-binding MarR family transcriptional regulator